MARALWSGSISFGLVNVPVKLYTAIKRKDVHFHQLDAKSGARIRNKRVSEKTGREIDADRIVKGYEISKGAYVEVTDEEIEAAEPERTRTIDIEQFVALEEIDPMQYDKTYWIAPADNKGASKAYALLRDAMAKSEKAAVGRFVLRTKEHLVLLRALDGAIVAHSLLFPDELVPAKDVEGLPVRVKADTKELRIASQLVESLTESWNPNHFHDTYREKLLDVIKRKEKGEEIVVEPAAKQADVLDLMAALEASVQESKKRRSSSTRKSSSRKKSA